MDEVCSGLSGLTQGPDFLGSWSFGARGFLGSTGYTKFRDEKALAMNVHAADTVFLDSASAAWESYMAKPT